MVADKNEDRVWDIGQELAGLKAEVRGMRNQLQQLPCIKHAEAIAGLNVKAGIWGMIGALLIAVPATLWRLFGK